MDWIIEKMRKERMNEWDELMNEDEWMGWINEDEWMGWINEDE